MDTFFVIHWLMGTSEGDLTVLAALSSLSLMTVMSTDTRPFLAVTLATLFSPLGADLSLWMASLAFLISPLAGECFP